ncbi:hypothetical protein G3I30_25930 [Actinospica acidiphila]|nr:hypothetical protein [Actinospica acidiphila]
MASPSAKALRDLRRRLGPAPVRSLFEMLAGPMARPTTPGYASAPTGRCPSTAAARCGYPIRPATEPGSGGRPITAIPQSS